MQVSYAAGLSDAAINKIEGGYAGQVAGNGSLDLNFNGNAHVNWDHLNVNKGESLNFNAVGGANGLTILNTVNKGNYCRSSKRKFRNCKFDYIKSKRCII